LFPDDSSTAKVAALLLLDLITATANGVAPDQLNAEAERLLREFPRWAKGYRGDDGKEQLVADAVSVLADFGLVRSAGEVVVALPAASRYVLTGARSSEESA
jgi:uncharacterized protein (TIGR02678 family)